MFRFFTGSTLALALIASPAFAATSHQSTTAHKHGAVRRVSHRIGHRIAHPLGQRGIAPERATQIQSALIREKYLTGSPSGQWDSETEAAMLKFQADHGWQTKLTPDSRALIALGLGPSTASGPQTLPANTYSAPAAEPAEAGTLASVHSIAQ
ncbi:MAG TPA: peptidoglycan-binding domain-containing protein [Acidobacteriaceae bacterium]|jgi:peptidoglycan hydrolase-like protein with peptidoglycan-binding domain|nr:peptidoglycan-binding domain-containing protein [Acidobacteriaceae bacterium]